MKTFERLRLKLNSELNLNIPKDAVFVRVRAGHEDITAGAWSWNCYTKDYTMWIGSQFTATEILKAKKLLLGKQLGFQHTIWID